MAIRVEELRIGNWLNKYTTPFQTTAEDIRDYNHSCQTFRTHLYKSITPIPLTEEWLIKFGFKFIDMMFENMPMRYWRKDFLIVEESKVVLIYNDKEIVTTVNVGFVHQLQNLYFALTQEELTIYEPTKQQ